MSDVNNKKKDKIKKLLIFAGMGVLFLGAMFLIFAPSSKDREIEAQNAGFNLNIPEPSNVGIVSDKQTAYEQEMMLEKKKERMKTLDDFIDITGTTDEKEVFLIEEKSKPAIVSSSGYSSSRKSSNTLSSSSEAYRNIDATLNNFYKDDTKSEVELLKEEIELLKQERNGSSSMSPLDEQLYVMEKSYEMATKYMPQMPGGMSASQSPFPTSNSNPAENKQENVPKKQSEKIVSEEIGIVKNSVVSSLSQPLSDAEFIEEYSKERNLSFNTVENVSANISRNTIRACIHEDQTLSDGVGGQRTVRIRLEEEMAVGGIVIPKNTILTGNARIGERLGIVISSVEYSGRIVNTDISVYDADGQAGLYIPGSLEINAAKEIVANTGSSMGTSINVTTNAKQQIASDVSRGVLQGTSQYVSKKISQVKVHLKAGHKVMLFAKEK